MINIGVSACLLGQKVRYDGKHKFINLEAYFDPNLYKLTPICPEVEMGMSIPRPPIQIINDGQIKLVQVGNNKIDYTKQMYSWFEENRGRISTFSGLILKSKSPSCGNQTTAHYDLSGQFFLNDGLFVSQIKSHLMEIKIIDENDLINPTKFNEFKQSLI